MLGELVAGRYRIERELGRGGFGAVYVAVQEDLGRRVALKLLHHRHLEGVGFDRFRREALLAQQLSHPNTVRLFDFGVHDGGPFIVFELLVGESLASLVRRAGPLPPARVVHIAAQVLKSLMEAHHHGIVHRDIKPANVFVCEYAGELDFVKVLDFGIAKSVSDESAPLTATGDAVGTPSYMPPEQLSGGTLGPATDLYAVGLMIAEMLSGTRVMRGSPMEVALRQLDPQPLAFPDVVRSSPLWPVVARSTQKRAAERFSSAAEMLAALELQRGPISSQSGWDPISHTLPVSATDPAQPFSPTPPRTPHSIPPAKPSMKNAIAGIGLVLLLGGGLLVLAVGAVLATLFVDFESLLGQEPSVAAADAGAAGSATGSNSATTTAGSADADAGAQPSSGTAATATASPGKQPLPATTGTTTAAAKTKSGSTFGQACVSNADCKGAYERCGQARVCECTTLGGWNKPRACGSRCVANTDPENCGACGKRCANDEICTTSSGGSPEHPICIPCAKAGVGGPMLLCGPHKCVAPNSDSRHCGGCDKKCAPGQSCVNGTCE